MTSISDSILKTILGSNFHWPLEGNRANFGNPFEFQPNDLRICPRGDFGMLKWNLRSKTSKSFPWRPQFRNQNFEIHPPGCLPVASFRSGIEHSGQNMRRIVSNKAFFQSDHGIVPFATIWKPFTSCFKQLNVRKLEKRRELIKTYVFYVASSNFGPWTLGSVILTSNSESTQQKPEPEPDSEVWFGKSILVKNKFFKNLFFSSDHGVIPFATIREFNSHELFCLSGQNSKDVWPASPPQPVRRVSPGPPAPPLLASLPLFLLFLLLVLLLRRSGGSVLARLGPGRP